MAYPRGFVATGIYAGIKRNPRKLDLAVICSATPATVAGVTTRNRIVAAPVVQARKIIRSGTAQAIIVNSGNANACTGPAGVQAVSAEVQAAAWSLGVKRQHVVIASTGIIGVLPPVAKLQKGIQAAAKNLPGRETRKQGWDAAARAIMTTDFTPKQKWVTVYHGGKSFTVGGIAKGSGMIHPDMGTMLAFVVTDLGISKTRLHQAVAEANRLSFNRISVDGDTSTNDMALVMANGMSGLKAADGASILSKKFQATLNTVCIYLAKEIVGDGEGATKRIHCRVTGALSEAQAEKVAKAIVGSSLVKTAMHGEDPNWGRIVAAAGRSGERLNPAKLNLWFGKLHIFKNGRPAAAPRWRFRTALRQREIGLRLDLGLGKRQATCWGCDLSAGYVKINSAYS